MKTKKNITAPALKTIAEFGLDVTSTTQYLQNLIAVCTDETKLRRLWEALFEEPWGITPYEEIDLVEINTGVRDFLQRFLSFSQP